MSRERRLSEGYELVVRTMNLRPPQAEALRELRDALRRLPDRLSACAPEQRREFLSFKPEWRHPYHPTFTLALATGLGKTRLAGAIIAFLWLTNEARTFLILAPRRAVLRRFESALDPRFREYLFVNPQLVPEPSIVRADEIDSPTAVDFSGDLLATGPRIYLLSPQLIATSARFDGGGEFLEQSAAEALRKRGDLVAILDEAHHVGRLTHAETTAWSSAIRSLEPCMQIGLTATPRGEEGENILYDYPLNKALADARYTKAVQILVRHFAEEGISTDDVDHITIDYARQRLERKTQAANEAAAAGLSIPVKPVAIFFARDIDHAQKVRDWVIGTRRFTEEEVLLTHSKMSRSEEDIERLLNIEKPANPVRVVINVMELMEGWDVTNVYVVAPLRALATFTGALQAMGRGLRLPAGRRLNHPELDTLDVICFGRQSLAQIVNEATQWEGREPGASSNIRVTDHTQPDVVRVAIHNPIVRHERLAVANLELVHQELSLFLRPEALHRVKEALVSGVELAASRSRISGVAEKARLQRDRFVQTAAMRVIRQLPAHLSDEIHLSPISTIITQWLDQVSPGQQWIDYDPFELGEEISRQLLASASQHAAVYHPSGSQQSISFPPHDLFFEVTVAPGTPAPEITTDNLPSYRAESFIVRQPYAGWTKGLYRAYAFESQHEAKVAWMLDTSAEVIWWTRNEPRRLVIPTPAGNHFPDFLAALRSNQTTTQKTLLLEVKGDLFWEPPNSLPRLKAAAAIEWCRVQNELGASLEYRVALQSDIEVSASWPELCRRLISSPVPTGMLL